MGSEMCIRDRSLLEYIHCSKIVGKSNIIFTNIGEKYRDKLRKYGKVYKESVENLHFKSICVLDPSAKKQLSKTDGKRFKYFVIGGILGDFPRRRRTAKILKKIKERRNLGKRQFSTDNAIYVAKEILKGRSLEDFKFKNGIEIPIGKNLSVILPFRFVIKDGKPLLPEGLIDYLKKRRTI